MILFPNGSHHCMALEHIQMVTMSCKASWEGVHPPSLPLLVIPVYSDSNPFLALYRHKYIRRSCKYQPTWIPEYVLHDTCSSAFYSAGRSTCQSNVPVTVTTNYQQQDKNKEIVCDCCQLYVYLWHKCSYVLWNKNTVSPETAS